MPKHPHAELMKQYAEDAMETDKPWERWEFKTIGSDVWVPKEQHPDWYPYRKYRRKPRTITINGIEVPEPTREPPKKGSYYWVATPDGLDLTKKLRWVNDSCDRRSLRRGLCHSTHEAAETHAKALIAASGGVWEGGK